MFYWEWVRRCVGSLPLLTDCLTRCPDDAGKTTLLERIKGDIGGLTPLPASSIRPTVGVNVGHVSVTHPARVSRATLRMHSASHTAAISVNWLLQTSADRTICANDWCDVAHSAIALHTTLASSNTSLLLQWDAHYFEAHSAVFVIDASAPERRLDDALALLSKLAAHAVSHETPLLILLNKHDVASNLAHVKRKVSGGRCVGRPRSADR